MGVSRRFGGFGGPLEEALGGEMVDVEDDEEAPRDSKALILEASNVEGAMKEK